jgi:hypothetical protein
MPICRSNRYCAMRASAIGRDEENPTHAANGGNPCRRESYVLSTLTPRWLL